MTEKSILVMASLDTKGEAIDFLCDYIRKLGRRTMTLDFSMMKEPSVKPDISSVEVAIAGGGSKKDTIGEVGNRAKRQEIMIKGAIKIANKLFEEGKIDGLIGFGGVSNAQVTSEVCKSLPFGFPKFILSSSAGQGYNFIGRGDITLSSTNVDTDTMNVFLKNSIVRAAHMICGAAESEAQSAAVEIESIRKTGTRVIAMTQLAIAECAAHIVDMLRKKGSYEVITFHANGVCDMMMEDLIESGVTFDAVLDLCVAGVSEYLLGGNRAAEPTRLEAAGKKGIPQIISSTGLDLLSCGPLSRRDKRDGLWAKRGLKDRKIWVMDDLRVLVKVSEKEAVETAKIVAEKLNRSKAPVKFLVPLLGSHIANKKGEDLYQPEIDRLIVDTLKQEVDPEIVEIREYDLYINGPEFAAVVVSVLGELLDDA